MEGDQMNAMTDDTIERMEPSLSEPLYAMRGVERAFRSGGTVLMAVAGIDMEIFPGEFVAIEGPSGSGKSTLLQLLGGLDKPTGGSVRFGEVDMTSADDKALTRLRAKDFGFVFQSFNLIPTLSAAENVEAAMVTGELDKGARRARTRELLSLVGLADRSHHLPSKLSGGEQQRVAIARALANGPRVILADEPTGNLDSATAEDVVGVLGALSKDRGVTVIVVTHSQEVARRAERRIRMRDGRLVPEAEGA
jgi:putative ABC transport system ATP-binding protein